MSRRSWSSRIHAARLSVSIRPSDCADRGTTSTIRLANSIMGDKSSMSVSHEISVAGPSNCGLERNIDFVWLRKNVRTLASSAELSKDD